MGLSPVTILLERPKGTPLVAVMNDVRSWLDSKKIEQLGFKSVVGLEGIGFEIRFRNQDEADLFEREFA